MFDLKLTDVFSTLCIGILSLALITYFYFIINKFFIKNKFDEDVFSKWIKETLHDNYAQSGYMILAIVTVYCLGVIAGDLTGRMTDSDSSHKNYLLRELKWASRMKSQENTRKEALVDSARHWDLTPLGNSVLRSQAIVANANHITGTDFFNDTVSFDKSWTVLRNTLTNDSAKITRKKFGRFLQQIYYTGKNWCFSKDHEPLNELKAIQNRIDLSRSMVLLLTFSIQLLLFIVVINLCLVVYLKVENREKDWKFWKKRNFNRTCYLLQIGFLIAFAIVLIVSEECYEINQDNYNKRAYGYYVSEINRLEFLKPAKTTEESQTKR